MNNIQIKLTDGCFSDIVVSDSNRETFNPSSETYKLKKKTCKLKKNAKNINTNKEIEKI